MDDKLDMAAISRIVPEVTAIRRDIHAHPELAYTEHRTAAIVAAQLRALGITVTEGIGGTGLVGTLAKGSSPRSIGLRADMDALGFEEKTGLAWASTHPGVFHGCGHDGHTAMLLGAARFIKDTVDFDGVVHFIFQPAEEGSAGARAMIEDGLFERFPCDEVYALHNWPELPAGQFQTRAGPIMAAADRIGITLTCRGGHAAQPHLTSDALLAAADLVLQLNTIVSRRVPAHEAAVLSVTVVQGGTVHNVIPSQGRIMGTARTFSREVQKRIERAVRDMVAGVAQSHGVDYELDLDSYYPPTINAPQCAEKALAAAAAVEGIEASVAPEPAFTSEDFSFMLEAVPGAYCWLGQGVGVDAPALHTPRYDFNDDVTGHGIAWFANLVRQQLGPQKA